MKTLAKRALNDRFIKNNIVFFCGTFAAAFLNYLYYPILGRIMTTEGFGEVQTVISLSMQLSIILAVFGIITVNIVSNNDDAEMRAQKVRKLQKIGYLVGGILFSLPILFSPFLKSFFHFTSAAPFVLMSLSLLVGISSTFRMFFLQGANDFYSVSVSGILASMAKIVFAGILVLAGLHTFGAIAGLLASQVMALLYLILKTKEEMPLSRPKKTDWVKELSSVKSEIRYGTLVFMVLVSTAFLYTADVLFIKRWFSPEEAGLYGGVATIARIIFFATGSIAAVMMPSIKLKNRTVENHKVLFRSLLITSLVGGAALLVFSLFPDMIITLLLGKKYLYYSYLLPKLSLAIFFASLANLLFMYKIALRRYLAALVSLGGILGVSVLSYLDHSKIEIIVNNILLINTIVFFFLTIPILYERFIQPNNIKINTDR